ncbi:MAG: hypothetical protein Athens101428_770 [Candidatus Berkelbacteria bacterium Athens1014_28]|uniref:RRM domain-containing protein n=1 Tax=Candidatus Berkelbacteria bacterium Athens1014_28 TaxID=2017145 RepID=A0A554LJ93_9BACT|nr:MAG: hypothetical protein Athens101428_770 [Candidatus Berkelbacteria bacterium Athens1014_28]
MTDEKNVGDSAAEEKNKLYVGNLPYVVDNAKLAELFSVEGVEVVEASVVYEREDPSRSRGYGFVTVGDEKQAEIAIEKLNGSEIEGRKLVVNVKRPRTERRDSGFNRSY